MAARPVTTRLLGTCWVPNALRTIPNTIEVLTKLVPIMSMNGMIERRPSKTIHMSGLEPPSALGAPSGGGAAVCAKGIKSQIIGVEHRDLHRIFYRAVQHPVAWFRARFFDRSSTRLVGPYATSDRNLRPFVN